MPNRAQRRAAAKAKPKTHNPKVIITLQPDGRLRIYTNLEESLDGWKFAFQMLAGAGASVTETIRTLMAQDATPRIILPNDTLVLPTGAQANETANKLVLP